MLEPRRLAAKAAAQRLAAELGEPLGQQVGYSVRLESCISAATRLEVLTDGLFLRRLQANPGLDRVDCLIFDEFHERGADTDLSLALVRQARELLRPELRLVLMSATLNLAPLAEQLPGATVLTSEGRCYPVAISHQPPRPGERLAQQVVRALEQHWLEPRGDGETVLVFLPGQREIQDCSRAIAATDWGKPSHQGVECVHLHGNLPLEAQGRAIGPASSAAGTACVTGQCKISTSKGTASTPPPAPVKASTPPTDAPSAPAATGPVNRTDASTVTHHALVGPLALDFQDLVEP
jgi:ATP-dependent helicase HrpB